MQNFKNIKNIIFDFGGVIINLDFNAAKMEFERLKINDVTDFFMNFTMNDLLYRLEIGTILPQDFREAIKIQTSVELTDSQIDDSWNKIIADYPPQNIELLKKVKNNYRSFLLSNTNAIHYNYFTAKLQNEFSLSSLHELFETAYFSHELHMRKPDTEIFLHVLKENNLLPEETLFLDDNISNIEAANRLGINTILISNERKITDLFDREGKLILF
ncbi:MAG: HAD family phosphatase [Endomicrobiia bacterium]